MDLTQPTLASVLKRSGCLNRYGREMASQRMGQRVPRSAEMPALNAMPRLITKKSFTKVVRQAISSGALRSGKTDAATAWKGSTVRHGIDDMHSTLFANMPRPVIHRFFCTIPRCTLIVLLFRPITRPFRKRSERVETENWNTFRRW